MPTITLKALEWIQDQVESKDAIIDDLEEELEAALDENASLKAWISRVKSTGEVV